MHRSITDFREQELVTHVLNDVRYRDTLLNIKGLIADRAHILDEVPLQSLRPTCW